MGPRKHISGKGAPFRVQTGVSQVRWDLWTIRIPSKDYDFFLEWRIKG